VSALKLSNEENKHVKAHQNDVLHIYFIPTCSIIIIPVLLQIFAIIWVDTALTLMQLNYSENTKTISVFVVCNLSFFRRFICKNRTQAVKIVPLIQIKIRMLFFLNQWLSFKSLHFFHFGSPTKSGKIYTKRDSVC
jgi:hypothetical protein